MSVKVNLLDHNGADLDFLNLTNKLNLKVTKMKNDEGTIVEGNEDDIKKMYQTIYGNNWETIYKDEVQ